MGNRLKKRQALFELHQGLCFYCQKQCFLNLPIHSPKSATIDHVIPKKFHGKTLVLSCYSCNNKKGHNFVCPITQQKLVQRINRKKRKYQLTDHFYFLLGKIYLPNFAVREISFLTKGTL